MVKNPVAIVKEPEELLMDPESVPSGLGIDAGAAAPARSLNGFARQQGASLMGIESRLG